MSSMVMCMSRRGFAVPVVETQLRRRASSKCEGIHHAPV
jgi:hypothetical protein